MRIVRRWWVPVLGAIALVAGVSIARAAPASFGWFAYAPLTSDMFVPPLPTWQFVVGLGLAGAGIALLAGWVGYLLGRRRE